VEYSTFRDTYLPYLKQGYSIYFSMGNHVIKLVALMDDYMVVDDPYGCLCNDDVLKKRSIDNTGVYCSSSRKMSCCQHTTAYVSPCKTNDTSGKNNPGHHCRWNASGVTPIKLYNIQVVGLK